jgi:hypothetical protein
MINDIDDLTKQLKDLKDRLKGENDQQYQEEIAMVEEAIQELQDQRNEMTKPAGSMTYRTRPRLKEEIQSLLFAMDGVPNRPTESQLERSVSLEVEAQEKEALLEKTKEEQMTRINESLAKLPTLNLKVKKGRS